MIKLKRVFQYSCCPRFIGASLGTPYKRFTSYTRLWGICIMLLSGVSLVPLGIMTTIDYKLTKTSLVEQNQLRLLRVTSNTRRSVAHFLEERIAALQFTLQEESFQALSSSDHLQTVLNRIKLSFGGLTDLGVIDADGRQTSYAGPFGLEGRSYQDQEWFATVMKDEVYISDVFLGFRNSPHMFIAVRGIARQGTPFILRATLDITRLASMLSTLEVDEGSDAFLINQNGTIQTPSKHQGEVLNTLSFPIPEFSERTAFYDVPTSDYGRPLLVGYAFITDSPFILLMTNPKDEILSQWRGLRQDLLGFFMASILLIIVVIYFISTYMINHVYESDQKQAEVMQHMEDTNRLASIGRLAAGVAHEINNPLAIINMKAGLIKDMFELKGEYQEDHRLMEQVDAVISSVERCGLITKQLLGFAREVELNVQDIDIDTITHEVLGFLGKEASYRGIEVQVDVALDVPTIRSDRGKLQQILLNIINNAFQAMQNGGSINIEAFLTQPDRVAIVIADTGPGISTENLKKIFEPFFSTKKKVNGSGLGLSITYGLVKKLHGSIEVESQPGIGTTFTLTFPLSMEQGDENEDTVG